MLNFELTPLQIKQIASSIDLKDVKNYIDNHKQEYNNFLKQEERQKNTEDKQNTNDNSLWTIYTDDTICKILLT